MISCFVSWAEPFLRPHKNQHSDNYYGDGKRNKEKGNNLLCKWLTFMTIGGNTRHFARFAPKYQTCDYN
jgi:hypothetical protein